MEKITIETLKTAGIPVIRFSPEAITLLLDSHGKIIDSLCHVDFKFASVQEQLRAQGDILKFFRLRPGETLAGHAAAGDILHTYTADIRLDEALEPFYSVYPVLNLRVYSLPQGRFLGVVRSTGIAPTHFEPATGTLVYTDGEDRLSAFFHSFFERFGKGFPDPASLLGRPMSAFFSPTPLEIQKRYLDKVPSFPESEGAILYEKIFPASTGREEQIQPNHSAIPRAGGLTLSGTGPQGATLTLLRPMDIGGNDVRVTLEYVSKGGQEPLVIFGDLETPSGYKDDFGYSLGLQGNGREFIVKRQGIRIGHFSRQPREPGPRRMVVCKTGGAFSVTLDGEKICGLYDIDFIPKESCHLSLYLRRGASCVLKRLTVATRPSPSPYRRENLVVRGNDRNHYLLNPFYNLYLSAEAMPMVGYRLQDVTELLDRVRHLEAEYEKQVREGAALREMLERERSEKSAFAGKGPAITAIREKAARIAPSPATVLLEGPTGAGKEVLARFIHGRGPRPEGPFVKVDCSTLPRTLMESELFGYEPGAFTGARKRKAGLLEQANRGTLFLDELNNLTLETQAKLLTFLQDQTITRIGGNAPVKLTTRIIAACNQDLKDLVRQGAFREDLFFRIAVVSFRLPPLKDRKEDLPDLAHHFLAGFNAAFNKSIQGFAPAAMRKLFNYSWPGNIRELRNAIEQAALFCDASLIQPEHFSFQAPEASPGGGASGDRRRKINLSAEELKGVLKQSGGRVTEAAERLSVTRRALYNKLEAFRINPDDFRLRPRKT